jgi:hypothetical protein
MDTGQMVQTLKWGERQTDSVRLTIPHLKKPAYYEMLHSPGQKAQWRGNVKNPETKWPFLNAPRKRYVSKKGPFKHLSILVEGGI